MIINSNRFESVPSKGVREQHRLYLRIAPEVFREEFLANAAAIMHDRNEEETEFLIEDEKLKHLINQMYYYLVGDKRFEKDLKKGLYFFGTPGFGKTIILLSLIGIIEKYTPRVFMKMTAREFVEVSKQVSVYKFKKRTMFLDDIFKETLEAEWNKHAFIKLLEAQYNYAPWLFLASNYDVGTIRSGYGDVTFDRMRSMVNFYRLEAKKSKRK